MSKNNTYWQIHCGGSFEKKKTIIELPLDMDFKLKAIAAEKSLSPEEFSIIIIEEYINKNYKKKNILRDLLK